MLDETEVIIAGMDSAPYEPSYQTDTQTIEPVTDSLAGDNPSQEPTAERIIAVPSSHQKAQRRWSIIIVAIIFVVLLIAGILIWLALHR